MELFLCIGFGACWMIAFLFCGYKVWKASQFSWQDTPEQASSRRAMNKKLGLYKQFRDRD